LKPVRISRHWKLGLFYLVLWVLFAILFEIRFTSGLAEGILREGSRQTDAAVRLQWFLWIGSAVLVLGVAAPFLLHLRRLERGIQQVSQFSQRMMTGNLEPIPLEQKKGELAEVVQALNELGALHERSIRLLTEERNRSNAILRSMVEGVAVIEPGQKIAFCNEAFCQALGLVGVPCAGRLLVEVTRQSGLLDLFQRALASLEKVSGETEISTKPSKIFAVTAAPVLTGGGRAVVMVLHDITELRHLERTRRDFVANVSHEFKTPLTAIQGFAETLLAGAMEDKENSGRFLEIIRDHAVRLGRVTNDLLKLSQIEAGRLQLDLRPVVVDELMQACVETVRLKAEKKQLVLSAECTNGLPPILADAARLRESLLNLLDNALQYTPSGGRVSVRADLIGSEMVLAVSDTGMGIPKSNQARVFERFYRMDDARSREVGGTGLGLSIAKHLIEAHGGRIELQSQVGQGSTFSIILPPAAS
jgi:two-component system, OmpR family, phosphate regulon sensor histidine kinase PhoR